MKAFILTLACISLFVMACEKSRTSHVFSNEATTPGEEDLLTAAKSKTYIIYKGDQSCTPNPFVLTSKLKIAFTAVFDSSYIYTTAIPGNQIDINKLYGFSDCG
ncbi:hypothetical protein BH10BAC2_BH10BAC2_30820 [soil metagenome]